MFYLRYCPSYKLLVFFVWVNWSQFKPESNSFDGSHTWPIKLILILYKVIWISVWPMCLLLTYEQLAVELQVEVSVSRSFLCGDRKSVQPQRRLFDVPLRSDSMPPVVVQRHHRLHMNLQRPVTDVEGENHPSGGWWRGREGGDMGYWCVSHCTSN